MLQSLVDLAGLGFQVLLTSRFGDLAGRSVPGFSRITNNSLVIFRQQTEVVTFSQSCRPLGEFIRCLVRRFHAREFTIDQTFSNAPATHRDSLCLQLTLDMLLSLFRFEA
jgi:hypothetical protein